MSWVPTFSMCMALAAVCAHAWAVRELHLTGRAFSGTWAAMSAMTACLAAAYFIGYAWLVFGDPDRARWSETLSYVGVITWPLVWVLPGLIVGWVARGNRRRDE